ncbi:hypothetical protein EVAR_64270_1 [Eumeta japonica]|uniref:Uncharacterized protein n=1 Tax=Eumeta variegata TaxID=151549 RepID=A0A4C2AAX5_EUMVA|nr:hypothetical protein EVAR_64270_1 [Eumeta japonica]
MDRDSPGYSIRNQVGAYCIICVVIGGSLDEELADNFFKVMFSQAFSGTEQLSSERKRQRQENRKKITPIVNQAMSGYLHGESNFFCGKQGVPSRGKTDSGRIEISPEREQPLQNDGNFQALLRYGAESRNKDLAEHLNTSQKNALYTST